MLHTRSMHMNQQQFGFDLIGLASKPNLFGSLKLEPNRLLNRFRNWLNQIDDDLTSLGTSLAQKGSDWTGAIANRAQTVKDARA